MTKRLTVEERKAKLQKQEDDLIAKQSIIKSKLKKLNVRAKTQERKDNTRRAILIGQYFIKNMSKVEIKNMMDEYLDRDNDRILFDLEVLPQD